MVKITDLKGYDKLAEVCNMNSPLLWSIVLGGALYFGWGEYKESGMMKGIMDLQVQIAETLEEQQETNRIARQERDAHELLGYHPGMVNASRQITEQAFRNYDLSRLEDQQRYWSRMQRINEGDGERGLTAQETEDLLQIERDIARLRQEMAEFESFDLN